MPKSTLNLTFLLLFAAVSIPATAQKVKYKDVYALLSTKQYDAAEPFLKTYLKDNIDNPNAYLYMGTIYQEKIALDDILLGTDKTIQHMDSAILYYDKARTMMTEKEIKKNKEYYESYNKRDLSTGEFGVKLDYVQFDLEKRISALRESIDKVKMVKHYFTSSESLYKRSQELFLSIQQVYPAYRELYLRADENTIKNLNSLASRYDSAIKAFDNYKISLSNYGKTKYNQKLTVAEIKEFKSDGQGTADFFNETIQVWDYKKFATAALRIIENDVLPAQESLVKYDMEINKLKRKLETDSVSVKGEVAKLAQTKPGDQLMKFDEAPLPLDVFAIKMADLNYKSTVIENKAIRAGNDLALRLAATQEELKQINRVDSLTNLLSDESLDDDILNYQQFVKTTFTKGDIFKTYINGMKEYASREQETKTEELAVRLEAVRWLINGADSIPLFTEPTKRPNKFHPLVLSPGNYTSGLAFTDSVSAVGYFYNIPVSHKPDIKVSYAVDKLNFREKRMNIIHGLATADPAGQVFFTITYSERQDKTAKYPSTVAKIYKSDGLSWSSNIPLDFIPQEITFVPESGELHIKSGANVTRLDKNGKVVK
jgi:tetratricopeptide (TPR) repeat protein